MDFDLSKENVQPLQGGRNASQLEVALQSQTDMEIQRELMQQKGEFEQIIKTYTGDDPLKNWYNYILWMEQSFPKLGHEGNLISLLEYCLQLFERDERYQNDRRLCKLFIKYIDLQSNPLELFHMMYAQGLCRGCADFYKAWAYYHEAAGDFQNAHRVFENGRRECAQPSDELDDAHQNLIMAAGQHIIYGPNERELTEKRQALTSLATLKHGLVGSVRHPSSAGPGTFGAAVGPKPNASVPVYVDNGQSIRGAEAAPNSIITAAKRQELPKENTLKPGPWTTVPVKKRHAAQKLRPSFTVHEDSGDEDGLKSNIFVAATLENYSDWIVSLTIPEPKDERMVPMYPKSKVYVETSTEYSLEELRGRRYILSKNRLQVAPAETSQAVQSILGDITMDCTPNKDKDKFEQNSHHSISKQENMTFGHQQKTFLSFANHDEQISEKQDSKLLLPSPRTSGLSPQQHQNSLQFDIWNSPNTSVIQSSNKAEVIPKFSIYEQSNLALQEQIEPKGSAMKTPFKDLNAEELAETGSRGGMDVAAAAPVDSAKRLLIDDDDSSSYEQMTDLGDLSCNTQMFNFNLNAMKVSTPQNKPVFNVEYDDDSSKIARKQLFTESLKEPQIERGKALSPILEETKSYAHSSSSGSTKSSLFNNHTKPNNMATISEEHNSYLAQNLMVNAALRSSSLGDLMDFGPPSSPVAIIHKKTINIDSNTSIPTIPTPAKVVPLDYVPSDPFKQAIIDKLLQRVCFPGPHIRGYHCVNSIPKLSARRESITIGFDKYIIEKQLGKGTYGTVFRGIDLKSGNTVALKQQPKANKWEFYICRELQSRLVNHPLRERFMDVRIGYFSEQGSVLISEFMPCGSLLDVANMVKQKSGRAMKESLCIHFCLEMLKVVQAMHEVKIIHADVKPDNFLVKLFPNDTVGLHLIDFGCSIDMTLFPPGASFTRKVTTENFICCEMIDGKPWNYHTDLFCVAATAHVLLFEKYIQLQKKDEHWSISNKLPRYARLDLWNMFFSTLLNQQNGPADSVSLQAMLEDSLNHKFDDYHNEIRYLINIMKNR